MDPHPPENLILWRFHGGMGSIGIETAQNVKLDHEVASIGDRVVAYLIDALIIYAWLFLWFIIAVALSGEGLVSFGFVIVFVLALFPYMFYHLVLEVTMNGQSIGKRARKIKVARIDGGQPRLGQYLLRWVLRPIDGFYGIGLVVVLVNGRGQRLGDLAAGTTVVSLRSRLRLKDTLLAEVPAGHQVRFPEAIRLSDAQAAMVRDVINDRRIADHWALVDEMADKVRKVIGNTGEGMRPLEFLQAVLRDHVHLTSQQGTAQSTSARSTSL